jgi:UPF0755 protein
MFNQLNHKAKLIAVILVAVFVFAITIVWIYFYYVHNINNIPLVPIRVTIPEGYCASDIANKLSSFKNFNEKNFLNLASLKEGYLFPDTYFLTGKENESDIIKIMSDNFKAKAGDPKYDILVMASILEKEVKEEKDLHIVSGILWKRISADMPLQVDAEPETYKYKGLPLAPICNPGLNTIEAAKNPVSSPYWYYLSDKNGVIHYAKTLVEQNANKAKYLGH